MNPNRSASQNGLRRWMRAIWLLVGICSVAACGGSPDGRSGGGGYGGGGYSGGSSTRNCTSGGTATAATVQKVAGTDGQTAAAGATLRPAVKITCLSDNTTIDVSTGQVDWQVLSGGGFVTSGVPTDLVTTLPNASGQAEVPWTLGGLPGPQILRATYFGPGAPAAGIAVTFTATATATATHACGAAGGTDQSPPNSERIATSNETWTAAGSPHRGFQVTFSDGAVLTVEPGATVCVDELEFLNGGRLVAVGTATDRILFSSGQGAPSWAGIFLFPQFGAPSLIRFADIENPRYFSVGIHALEISDTRLVRTVPASAPICPQWLLHLAAGTRVERVVVERFGGNGCPALVVSTDDTYSPPGTTFSISARLLASAGDAIHTSLNRQLVLSNCEISGSAGDGLVSLEAGVFAPSIGGCSIVDNLGVGVRNEEPIRQVAAQGNWWGDAAGPGGPTGDGVAGDVDASNPSAAPVTLGY